jgi:hypothetical protein
LVFAFGDFNAPEPKKTKKITGFVTCPDLGQALQLVSYQARTLDIVVVDQKKLDSRST